MALTWKISHPERLVTVLGEGDIALRDVERYLDDVVVSDALPYPKLFDLGTANWTLSDTDMLVLAGRIRAYPAAFGRFGPIAIVAASDTQDEHARMFETLADVERPLRIFRTADDARKWLSDFA
jgi:hypothetical protein